MTGETDDSKADHGNTPGMVRLTDGLGPLVACPICGGTSGYELSDGSTFRWARVYCADCGADIGESRLKLTDSKLCRNQAADEVWNSAGAHVHMLRSEIESERRRAELLAEDIEALHKCLDLAGVPRADESGAIYSMWGRVLRFRA